jgi:hypothetical protein
MCYDILVYSLLCASVCVYVACTDATMYQQWRELFSLAAATVAQPNHWQSASLQTLKQTFLSKNKYGALSHLTAVAGQQHDHHYYVHCYMLLLLHAAAAACAMLKSGRRWDHLSAYAVICSTRHRHTRCLHNRCCCRCCCCSES